MKPIDLLILILVAAALALSVYLNGRRKRESSCCGRTDPVKPLRPSDRNRTGYPYEASARITGMTCRNCAVTVQNALNALDGVLASVRIDTKEARILCKTPPSEAEIARAVHGAGYGMEDFQVKQRRSSRKGGNG